MTDAVSTDAGVSENAPAPAAPAEVTPVAETPAPAAEATTTPVPEPVPATPRSELGSATGTVEIEAAPAQPEPPASAPATPAPASEPILPPPSQSVADTSIRSRLGQALEAIRFRKRAKLDKILALAAKKKSIRNDDIEKLLRVSDSTAQRYLKQLVQEGRLTAIKKGNDAWHEPR